MRYVCKGDLEYGTPIPHIPHSHSRTRRNLRPSSIQPGQIPRKGKTPHSRRTRRLPHQQARARHHLPQPGRRYCNEVCLLSSVRKSSATGFVATTAVQELKSARPFFEIASAGILPILRIPHCAQRPNRHRLRGKKTIRTNHRRGSWQAWQS